MLTCLQQLGYRMIRSDFRNPLYAWLHGGLAVPKWRYGVILAAYNEYRCAAKRIGT
jgi:hypothetical protein